MQNTSAYEEPRSSGKRLHKYMIKLQFFCYAVSFNHFSKECVNFPSIHSVLPKNKYYIHIKIKPQVEATSSSLERGSIPWLVRHQSKVSKAEETRKKGKMIKKITRRKKTWITYKNLKICFRKFYLNFVASAPSP